MKSTDFNLAISSLACSSRGLFSQGSISRTLSRGVTILYPDCPYQVSCVAILYQIENSDHGGRLNSALDVGGSTLGVCFFQWGGKIQVWITKKPINILLHLILEWPN